MIQDANLINTPFQRGECGASDADNRFSGFKPLKRFLHRRHIRCTPLKRGVNENGGSTKATPLDPPLLQFLLQDFTDQVGVGFAFA